MTGRVFVAGASGVLGRRVVPALVAAGHSVTANVRDTAAADRAERAGAQTVTVDLFDASATRALGVDHDAIVNVATSIPTGASSARRSAWAMNDRLRCCASANLASAMASVGGRYVGESITFPYRDGGDSWIDESHPCSYIAENETVRNAERAAADVTAAGGIGVSLRFAMFHADDSAHIRHVRAVARTGVFLIPGRAESFMSWIHLDDAASATIAALSAPAGLYNVAEPDPVTRGEHAGALGAASGRRRPRLVPPAVARLGGPAGVSLTRSQRVSSQRLAEATGWSPTRRVVDAW